MIPDRVNTMRKLTKGKEAQQRVAQQPREETEALLVESLHELKGEWDQQLLELIQDIKPDQFERLAQRVLRESGFTRVEVTGKSNDGGIDGIGILRVNLVSFHVVFQCKRWKGSVGPGVIRDFRGGMVGRADKGLVITTGTFTSEARKEATRDGAPAIDLVDGEALCVLLQDLELGVRPVKQFEVDEKFFRSL